MKGPTRSAYHPFLQRPKSIGKLDRSGLLPVHHAVQKSQHGLLACLLEIWPVGAMQKGKDGRSPLEDACNHWKPSLEAITLLVQYNPGGMDEADVDGFLPLHLATMRGEAHSISFSAYCSNARSASCGR